MRKNFKSGLIVLIVLILIIAATGFLSVWRGSKHSAKVTFTPSTVISNTENGTEIKASKKYKNEFIGAIYIEGTIQEENSTYNQQWLLSTINSLKNNKKNAGIAIFINSPGGTVYQADEVYLALEDYKTTGRPVYVYQGALAASGGYYISCAGNKIYANRNTLTGCIGVIMGNSFDLTGFFEGLGIVSTTIYSGKNKNMRNYNEPFTDEQKEIMQALCDECYDQFTKIVAKSRMLSMSTTYSLSDGRLFSAKQALEGGLIDKIDSWENMLKDLAENELKKPGIKVKTYKYEKKSSFVDMLTGKAVEFSNAKAAANLGLPLSVIENMKEDLKGPLYLSVQ